MALPEYFAPKTTPQGIWAEYTRCKLFNSSIDLYEQVKKNERMMTGDQWHGVKAPDMDKPVFNIIYRPVMYQVALLVSDNIGVSITHMADEDSMQGKSVAKYIEKQVDDVLEQTSFVAKRRECVRDAAVTGDCCLYAYWDTDADRPELEEVDNTSVLFGNPSVSDPQEQPFIIIEQARDLKDVKLQAFNAGVAEWETIAADDETNFRQSDTNYIGVQTCTVLKKFWKDMETGHIWFTECTRTATLKQPVDTELELYPIAWMTWEKVKERYHGKAAVTGYIDNQIAINRLGAGILWHERMNAFPKVFYDRAKFPRGWDNTPGAAYGVAGGLTDPPATAFEGPKMDTNVMQVWDKMISATRDFMGVNDVVLGNITPQNTSAIIAVQKATATPLEFQKLGYYQFCEDIIRVLIDLMIHNLGQRAVAVTLKSPDPVTGQMHDVPATMFIDFSQMRYKDLNLRVDIGEAAYWSEMTQTQTLDALFERGLVPPATYLEQIPEKNLPGKNEIVEAYQEQMQQTTGDMSVGDTKDITQAMQQPLPSNQSEAYLNNTEARMQNEMQRV